MNSKTGIFSVLRNAWSLLKRIGKMFRETPRTGKLKLGRYDPFAIDEEFYPEGWLTPKVQIKTYWDEDFPKKQHERS